MRRLTVVATAGRWRGPRADRYGFTLVELLVVIAIISVLAALLLPALEGALRVAERTACLGQMRQVAMATLFYVEDAGDDLPWVKSAAALRDGNTQGTGSIPALRDQYLNGDGSLFRCAAAGRAAYPRDYTPGVNCVNHYSEPWIRVTLSMARHAAARYDRDWPLWFDRVVRPTNVNTTWPWRGVESNSHDGVDVTGGNAVFLDLSGRWIAYDSDWLGIPYSAMLPPGSIFAYGNHPGNGQASLVGGGWVSSDMSTSPAQQALFRSYF
ncbi:MAG: type II secretion system protein [Planctomycetota bacterium]